jgi:molybdopterin-guanine dinucleotide biosynthesis protein A
MKKTKQCNIAGAILAGGKALRADGLAKGTIRTDEGLSIVQHLIREMSSAGIDDVALVANDVAPYAGYDIPVISDIRKGAGPMGGMESAFAYFGSRCEAVMFLPCDVPNLTAKDLLKLQKAYLQSDAPAVYARTGDFFCHSLCTVVHSAVARQISQAIDRGQLRTRDFWLGMNAEPVLFEDENIFKNLNTLDDVRDWYASKKNLC